MGGWMGEEEEEEEEGQAWSDQHWIMGCEVGGWMGG